MALLKILGTETEYGITVKNSETFDPIASSTLIVNSYEQGQRVQISWDYEGESPFVDARGFAIDRCVEPPKIQENSTINKILDNGARFYVDHAHPEFSTPECSNPRDVVLYEKAGDRILYQSMVNANTTLPADQQILLYKNNSDYKGNSYGYHENYLLDRRLSFDRIAQYFTTFLVTRQIFCGAGKVGAENRRAAVPFQISQRADFFETALGLDTMMKRPIVNTRDEPHADRSKYRRLHVITGDVNLSEYSTYLKLGSTALMLQMIEDGALDDPLTLQNPLAAMHDVSRDLSCSRPLPLDNGMSLSALEIQRRYLETAQRSISDRSEDPYVKDLIETWAYVLDCLGENPRLLCHKLDWVIKHELLQQYCDSRRCDWSDPRMSMLDLQYHDLRPEKSLYHVLLRQGHVERLVSDDEILRAVRNPPQDTRAYFRGQCLQRFRERVHGVSWGAISFNVDRTRVKRILMPEPGKGTKLHVEQLLEKSQTVEELLTNIAQ
ncbi:proteasome accessory factor PafA2 [candidate division KSB3 bacterium]|uniref:Proteasome accessory factor PafA2 n=1 Tax=candidate division KSB3 bacterium TaxID=2044937 RepID=A0A2G6E8Q9_9BACT|nr:MAG: proteasome accessory factor PafA2 [candidate division KSB3 bacterium]PIE30632.1 MAG: proteasome accessory factor PafA2 [candidate division KSB3 bacterium]